MLCFPHVPTVKFLCAINKGQKA